MPVIFAKCPQCGAVIETMRKHGKCIYCGSAYSRRKIIYAGKDLIDSDEIDSNEDIKKFTQEEQLSELNMLETDLTKLDPAMELFKREMKRTKTKEEEAIEEISLTAKIIAIVIISVIIIGLVLAFIIGGMRNSCRTGLLHTERINVCSDTGYTFNNTLKIDNFNGIV